MFSLHFSMLSIVFWWFLLTQEMSYTHLHLDVIQNPVGTSPILAHVSSKCRLFLIWWDLCVDYQLNRIFGIIRIDILLKWHIPQLVQEHIILCKVYFDSIIGTIVSISCFMCTIVTAAVIYVCMQYKVFCTCRMQLIQQHQLLKL